MFIKTKLTAYDPAISFSCFQKHFSFAQNFSLSNLNTLCGRVRGWKVQGEWIMKTSGLRFAYFRAWSCRENEQRLWTQPLWQRLLAGWGGSAHRQKCLAPKTGHYDFPAHLLGHRVFPSFLDAGARACARTHSLAHTRGLARAQSTPRRPRQATLPPRWAKRPAC